MRQGGRFASLDVMRPREHFSLSRQTADRYVGLYKVHLKSPNLSDLKIRRSLLYWMFLNPPKRRPSAKVIDAIMEEARTKWVGFERALQIEREIRRAENEVAEREGLPWDEPKQPVEPEDLQPELETSPPRAATRTSATEPSRRVSARDV
jgi:hypothetical protein